MAESGPAQPARVRSPVDVLRLVVGAALVVGGIAIAEVLDETLLGLSEDATELTDALPAWVRDVPAALLSTVLLAAAGGVLIASLVATRYRRLAMLGVGIGAAVALSVIAGGVIESLVDDSVRRAFDGADVPFRFRGAGDRLLPGDPMLAGAVAMVGITASFASVSLSRRLVAVLVLYAGTSVVTSGVPALGLVTDVGIGLVVASAVLLAVGRHALAPDGPSIAASLAHMGIEVRTLEPMGVRARASVPWIATTSTGDRVVVKAFGRDERSADLLFRALRWVRLRDAADHRPFASLRRAAEHEALVSTRAAALGVRTPALRGVAPVGPDGMALVHDAVDGVPADMLTVIDDDLLAAIWSSTRRLHAGRIAHRSLRLGNFLVDRRGDPWLIDFGFSELAGSDQQLACDVVELLASTAARVGVERAVDVAATHDPAALERAMPWMQVLALSASTRAAIGGQRGVEQLRTEVSTRLGLAPIDLVRLERVSRANVFTIVTLGLVAWFLLPQLADFDEVWAQTRSASLGWAALAAWCSALTYVAATWSLLGAIPLRLRFWPALTAQVGSSFANRITPAKVGGYAMNVRYFQRLGVPTPVSVTAVGLNAVVGVVVHLLLTLCFLLVASSGDAGEISLPSTGVVLGAASVLVAIAVVSAALPGMRRLVVTRVLPGLRAGWASIGEISHRPGRLVMLVGGAAAITLSYLGAMVASLHAFGASASFPLVGLMFLTASAVANVAPTPGGLGATEAALVATLSTVEETSIVIPAVFLYRLVTFWLPILPGWVALTYLRRSDRI